MTQQKRQSGKWATIFRIGLLLGSCSLLIGCSSIISHSQSGTEEDIHAKRSLGTALDDNAIAGKVEAKLRRLNEQFAAMVQVDSYNKIVLLTGRVPDQGFIDQASGIASKVPGVRQVHSEISKGEPTTISHYWYDAWLTTKVKSQLTLTSNAPAGKTKVRSFAGYIYLMGVMTPQEAKNATYVASRVPGAKKVISMIETIEQNTEAVIAQPTPPAQPAPPAQSQQVSPNTHYVTPIDLEESNQGFYQDNAQAQPEKADDQQQNAENGYDTQYQQPTSASPRSVEGF